MIVRYDQILTSAPPRNVTLHVHPPGRKMYAQCGPPVTVYYATDVLARYFCDLNCANYISRLLFVTEFYALFIND
jgi:hypothetical protein